MNWYNQPGNRLMNAQLPPRKLSNEPCWSWVVIWHVLWQCDCKISAPMWLWIMYSSIFLRSRRQAFFCFMPETEQLSSEWTKTPQQCPILLIDPRLKSLRLMCPVIHYTERCLYYVSDRHIYVLQVETTVIVELEILPSFSPPMQHKGHFSPHRLPLKNTCL